MYLLFRYHHITPSQFNNMGFGERTVIKTFMHYQIEKQNEEIEKMKKENS